MTDDNGVFSLKNNQGFTKLAITSLGYDTKVIDLKAGKANENLLILLKPTSAKDAKIHLRLAFCFRFRNHKYYVLQHTNLVLANNSLPALPSGYWHF